MDELMDMIIADESPSKISDGLKDMLYAKAAQRIDAYRPVAVNSLFTGEDQAEIEANATDEE